MIETLAIKTALSTMGGFLKQVPREVWYGIAAFAAWWVFSSHYIEQGREDVYAELREAEKEAQAKANRAQAIADTKAAERAKDEAKVLEELNDKIEEAQANDENSLDSLF